MTSLTMQSAEGALDQYLITVHTLASQAWTLAERAVTTTDLAMVASGTALLFAFVAMLAAVRR